MRSLIDPPIGIFGGTFDPVHNAHLHVAEEARKALGIDDFRMIPAGDPPHREGTFASPRHRLAMLELAVESIPGLAIDERELRRDGPSWMVDTLASLRAEKPNRPLLLVIGQDAANSFDEWRHWRRIFDLAHLVIMTRSGESAGYSPDMGKEVERRLITDPGYLRREHFGSVATIGVSRVDISSTAVRQRIQAGEEVLDWLPSPVLEYIEQHGLYR